jgi:hypothetical protein
MDLIHDGFHGYLCSWSARVLDYMSLYMTVIGMAMAISGGWDASGAGFVQLVVGTVIYPTCV